MKAALRGSYVDVVYFMGVNERYPHWFCEELYSNVFSDSDRYTFYVSPQERSPVYHEQILVEDYSVFIRKPNGDIFVTNYDAFDDLYFQFRFDAFSNSGVAAFRDDVIDYVECQGGAVISGYPDWFYEYFTEAINNPSEDETIFIDSNDGELSVSDHCAVLQNRYGEVRLMDWEKFLSYYDPDPGDF